LIEKSWKQLLNNWLDFSKSGSCEILLKIYKSIQELALKCPNCVYKQISEVWKILVVSINWVTAHNSREYYHSRPLLLKLVPDVVNCLKAIFSCPYTEYKLILEQNYTPELYELIRTVLNAMNNLKEMHIARSPVYLILEEEVIFTFIEFLPTTFSNLTSFQEYFKFIQQFLTFSTDDPRSDGFIRKALLIIKSLITVNDLDSKFLKEVLSELYKKFNYIIALRLQRDACKILLLNSEKPLWYATGKFFIMISTYLVNVDLYEDKNVGLETGDDTKESKVTEEVKGLMLVRGKKINEDAKLQEFIWANTINLLKDIIKISELSFNGMEEELVEEIVEKSQQLSIDLVNFIANILLPSSENQTKEIQKELINIIDSGFNAFSKTLFIKPFTKITKTLPKFCINTLINLCNSQEINEKTLQMKQRISGITTRVLINRCKVILHDYIDNERRSGQVPLNKYNC